MIDDNLPPVSGLRLYRQLNYYQMEILFRAQSDAERFYQHRIAQVVIAKHEQYNPEVVNQARLVLQQQPILPPNQS